MARRAIFGCAGRSGVAARGSPTVTGYLSPPGPRPTLAPGGRAGCRCRSEVVRRHDQSSRSAMIAVLADRQIVELHGGAHEQDVPVHVGDHWLEPGAVPDPRHQAAVADTADDGTPQLLELLMLGQRMARGLSPMFRCTGPCAAESFMGRALVVSSCTTGMGRAARASSTNTEAVVQTRSGSLFLPVAPSGYRSSTTRRTIRCCAMP